MHICITHMYYTYIHICITLFNSYIHVTVLDSSVARHIHSSQLWWVMSHAWMSIIELCLSPHCLSHVWMSMIPHCLSSQWLWSQCIHCVCVCVCVYHYLSSYWLTTTEMSEAACVNEYDSALSLIACHMWEWVW